jgi:hypothetical protein
LSWRHCRGIISGLAPISPREGALFFEETEVNQQSQKRVDAVFKKEQRAAEASAAWRDYQANQAAVDANMLRLRALRLAREAAATPQDRKPGRRAAAR